MSIQFHPLPLEVFPEPAQAYIARLNGELRDLFALEGVLRNPRQTRRSDSTVVRRSQVQVDVSRITPDISGVVSGSSTVIGAPALVLTTANIAGTTTTAVSTNSSIALFGTAVPLGLTGSGIVGTSAFAARADHRHPLTDTLLASGSTASLILTDSGPDETLTGNRGILTLSSVGKVNVVSGLNVSSLANLMSVFGGTASIPAGLVPTDATDRLVAYRGTTASQTRALLAINNWIGTADSAVAKTMGFNTFAYHSGSGSLTTTTFSGGLIGCRIGTRLNGGTGTISLMVGVGVANQLTPGATACTVTEGVGLNVEGLAFTGVTFSNQYSQCRIQALTAVGSLPLMHGLLVDPITVGTTKYAVKTSQKIVNIATDVGTETAGKGFYCLDANDGNFYRIGTSAGAIFITNLGTVAPGS